VKQLLAFAAASSALAVASAVYLRKSPSSFVLQELYKAGLALALVTFGSASLKIVLEHQRERRAAAQQWADRRDSIIREFVKIFSNFYSVRKLYHSAQEKSGVYQPGTDDYDRLKKELLKRSTELEGRLGALKVRDNLFQATGRDLGRKKIPALEAVPQEALNSAADADIPQKRRRPA